MKRVKQNFKKRIARKSQKLIDEDRRGSVIIVVITLLSTLMLLGFFLFAQTQQEVQNAEFFAQAAKKYEPLDVDPNTIFDAYLRQLILGADPDTEYNSGFYGGYNSLLPRMLGSDFAPYSGEGVNVVWGNGDTVYGSGEVPQADLDYDGTPDVPGPVDYLAINQGPSGSGSVQDFYNVLPQPDVDYSYPDHNAPYLTFYGYVPVYNATTGMQTGVELVKIPAFHRPALLRNLGVGSGQWYRNATTKGRVLAPHQEHDAFTSTGTNSGQKRFVMTGADATATGLSQFSEFPTDEGHWSNGNFSGSYDYPADPTGRGWDDAVYMDIGYPVQVDATTGRLFVPLVAATILDGESMANLNIHGNSSHLIVESPGGTIASGASLAGPDGFLTSSNDGVSRSEINPGWLLNSNPLAAAAGELDQYRFMFGNDPGSWGELSNMDLWFLMHGRAEFDSTLGPPYDYSTVIGTPYSGRHGEPARMANAINSRQFNQFAWPGETGTDDNSNATVSVRSVSPFGYPVDYFGIGEQTVTTPTSSFLRTRRAFNSNNVFPQFENYASLNAVTWASLPDGGTLMPNRTTTGPGEEPLEMLVDPNLKDDTIDQIYTAAENGQLQLSRFDLSSTGTTGRLLNLAPHNFNDSGREEEIRRKFTTLSSNLKAYSHKYSPNQVRNWEYVDADSDGIPEFPPINIGLGQFHHAQAIRPELYQLLFSEVNDNEHNVSGGAAIRKLQRKLSLNGVLDIDNSGILGYRTLTSHPSITLAAGQSVTTATAARPTRRVDLSGGNVYEQEILARVDRQKMARDIYTLLYLLGGAQNTDSNDGSPINYLTASNDPPRTAGVAPSPSLGTGIYTLDQCREMAQIAVNLVDYLDPDHVMTKFEYDTNLADGWNLDDYPYAVSGVPFQSNPTPLTSPTNISDTIADLGASGAPGTPNEERGVVYGQEEQLLCLSECAAFYNEITRDQSSTMTPKPPFDHTGTEWDDSQHNQFFFVELENISGFNFSASTSHWKKDGMFQVVVRGGEWTDPSVNDPDETAPDIPFNERRVTLRSAAIDRIGQGSGGASRYLTIGSIGVLDGTSDSMDNTPPELPSTNFEIPTISPDYSNGPSRLAILDSYNTTDAKMMGNSPGLETKLRLFPFDVAVDDTNYLDLLNTANAGQFDVFEPTMNADDYHDSRRVPTTNEGAEVLDLPDPMSFGTAGTEEQFVEVVLRRRANPLVTVQDSTSDVSSTDNPWVVVDRLRVPLGSFELDETHTTTASIRSEISSGLLTRTRGRYQPLVGDPSNGYRSHDDADEMNSLGGNNAGSTFPRTVRHHHGNHDYSNLAEILNLPLFGPERLNTPVAPLYDGVTGDPGLNSNSYSGKGPWRGLTMKLADDLSGGSASAKATGLNTFGERLLNPLGSNTAAFDELDNRWHRVLEFLSIPTNQNLTGFDEPVGRVADGEQDDVYRDYGPLNLNTLSHPELLAAMLDDQEMLNRGAFNPSANLPIVAGRHGADNRSTDWWFTYVLSRDQFDPILYGGGTGTVVPIPGIPGIGNPFRSLSTNSAGPANLSANTKSTLQTTLLRNVPKFPGAADDPRQLFEIGSQADHNNDIVDYTLKNKMLGKVMNYSTTQSNTFFVFLQIDYFEATVINNVTRVGGKLPDSPGYRGFYVVDRAKALETLTGEDLPPTVDTNTGQSTFSFNQNYNWRALVRHRQRLN